MGTQGTQFWNNLNELKSQFFQEAPDNRPGGQHLYLRHVKPRAEKPTVKPTQMFDLHNGEVEVLCYFEPLTLWFVMAVTEHEYSFQGLSCIKQPWKIGMMSPSRAENRFVCCPVLYRQDLHSGQKSGRFSGNHYKKLGSSISKVFIWNTNSTTWIASTYAQPHQPLWDLRGKWGSCNIILYLWPRNLVCYWKCGKFSRTSDPYCSWSSLFKHWYATTSV